MKKNFIFAKQLLLTATTIVTVFLLAVIVIRENYPERIFKRIYRESHPLEVYAKFFDIYSIYQGEKRIVMLGNSLTEGVNWNELLNRTDVANRGIGGDRTAGFIRRLDNVFCHTPKICFIEGGINDLFGGVAVEEITGNLTILVDTLQKCNIKPVLSTVTYVTSNKKRAEEINPKVKELNKQIYQLAKEKGVNIIDLNKRISDEDFLKNEYAVKDGIHFRGATYLVWKEEVEKILKQENI